MAFADHTRLPDSLQRLVDAELESGERVTWAEQPIPRRLARATLPVVLFGIPWTAFALFWMAMASEGVARSNGSGLFDLFPLFGLPFVLIGFGMLSAPWWAALGAKGTAYVLTDRRAIVIESAPWKGVSVRSFAPEKLGDLQRTQQPDGSGDLVFTQDSRRSAKGRDYTVDVGFLAIPDVKAAEERVRALAKGSDW